MIQNFREIFARVRLCLWTYSAIGLICLLLVCDVCNVAMNTGRVAIVGAGFQAPVLIGTIATKWVLKKRKVPKSEQF